MAHIAIISINDRCCLGSRTLSSILKETGHKASLIFFGEYNTKTYSSTVSADLNGNNNYHEEELLLFELLDRIDPDVIGFSFRSVSETIVLDLSKKIKTSFPNKPIVHGGIGATSNPDICIEHCDYLCQGEGDDVLSAFLDVVEKSGVSDPYAFLEVPNLWINRSGRIIKNRMATLITNLDKIPCIDYSADNKYSINAGRLIEHDGRYDNEIEAYPLMTSRGCPYTCTYCHNSLVKEMYKGEKYYRRRSVDHVINELIEERKRNPNLAMISIYDDSFPSNAKWLADFTEKYVKYINLPYWCFSYPTYINEETIELLVTSGCKNICMGCQSFSESTLDLYNRKTKPALLREKFAILKKYDINVQIDLISHNPLESETHKRETLEFLINLPKNTEFNAPPHKVWRPSISPLTLFPNTEMFDMISDRIQVSGEYAPILKDRNREDFWSMMYLLAFHDEIPAEKLMQLSFNYAAFSEKYLMCTVENGLKALHDESFLDFADEMRKDVFQTGSVPEDTHDNFEIISGPGSVGESEGSAVSGLAGFCCAPWSEGVLKQNGSLQACCRNGKSFGNWQNMGLTGSWKSEEFKNFRRSILKGIYPDEACRNCYQNGTARSLVTDLTTSTHRHLDTIAKFTAIPEAVRDILNLLSVKYPASTEIVLRLEKFFTSIRTLSDIQLSDREFMTSLQKLALIGGVTKSYLVGDLEPTYVAPLRQVGLSDVCNARCIQCPGLYYGDLEKGDTLDECYLDEAFSQPESMLDFFMNGAEFFAYRGWRNVAERLVKQGIKLSISTNGILLTEENIRYLIDNRIISQLNISMDGACKETLEEIRVNVDFEKLCNSIRYVFKYSTLRDYHFELSFSFVLMKRNFSEFPQLVRLVNDMRAGLPLPAVNAYCQGLEGYDVNGYNEFVAQEHHAGICRDELVKVFGDTLFASEETGIQVGAFYSTSIRDFVENGFQFPPMTDVHAAIKDQSSSKLATSVLAVPADLSENKKSTTRKIHIAGDMNLYFVGGIKEYGAYINEMTSEYLYRENRETELAKGGDAFTARGYCHVCNRNSGFTVNFENGYYQNGRLVPNWRESIICEECRLNNRTRGFVHVFENLTHPCLTTKIYIAEQLSPLYLHLLKKYPLLVGSEYIENDAALFVERAGYLVQHQDLTSLTFDDKSFDVILHQDVLEHIPNFIDALREGYRVLKPGGYLFFTAPFVISSAKNIIRSQMSSEGVIEHLLPPEYHGNPLDPVGCLAFYHFGWELLEQMKDIGFKDPSAVFYWSLEYGYLGGDQLLFMARK